MRLRLARLSVSVALDKIGRLCQCFSLAIQVILKTLEVRCLSPDFSHAERILQLVEMEERKLTKEWKAYNLQI